MCQYNKCNILVDNPYFDTPSPSLGSAHIPLGSAHKRPRPWCSDPGPLHLSRDQQEVLPSSPLQ